MKNRISFTLVTFLVTSLSLFAQTFDDGLQQFRRRNFESAKKIFSQNTTDPNYIYWLGQTMIAQNAPANEVKSYYQNAIAQNPKADLLKVGLSQLEMAEGKLADAKNVQAQAIKNNAKDLSIYAAVGRAHLLNKNNDLNFAIESLTKVAEYNAKKKVSDIPTILGQLYLKKQNTSEATYAFRDAASMDTTNAEPVYLNALMYSEKPDEINTNKFLELMNSSLSRDAKFAPAYYDLFYYYYKTDQAKARTYFEKYLTVVDKTSEMDYNIANVNYILGDYDKAISLAKEAISKNTSSVNPKLYKLISFASNKLNNLDSASEYLQKYLTNAQESTLTYADFLEAADLSFKLNQMDNVSQQLAKSLELATEKPQKYNVAAKGIEIYAPKVKELADDEVAVLPLRKELEKYRELYYNNHYAPTNVEMYSYGLENYYLKDWAKTNTIFKQYAEKYPEQVQGYFFAGVSCKELQDIPNATTYLTKAVEVGIGNAEKNKFYLTQALYNLAEIAINNKEYSKVKEYGAKILSYDPNDANAKEWVK